MVHKCDIKDVTEEKGEECINWIKIKKQKLQQRECVSMKVRAKKLQNIINHQCELFSTKLKPQNIIVFNHNNLVSNAIIDECSNKLYLTLERWHGINVTKTKNSLTKQKNIYWHLFWIKLFLHLPQFTKTAASQFFTNNNYSNLASLYSRNLGCVFFILNHFI